MNLFCAEDVLDKMEEIENGALDEWEYWEELRRWLKRRVK